MVELFFVFGYCVYVVELYVDGCVIVWFDFDLL